ncbi:hypothetical protein AB3363_10950 (plasmid) [Leuconostoc mesenteroides]|uniref:hypothetical protein n=1 Tax=Leuconostoc mesenteroides TaxID=1245 RepID=UPI003524B6A1
MISSVQFENTKCYSNLSNKDCIASKEFVFFFKMILAENGYKIDNIENNLAPKIANITLSDDNTALKQRIYVESTISNKIPNFVYLIYQERHTPDEVSLSTTISLLTPFSIN